VVQTIRIIGSGRVGSAVAARLRERAARAARDLLPEFFEWRVTDRGFHEEQSRQVRGWMRTGPSPPYPWPGEGE
jgi:homoserine dehydrogenase